MAEQHSLEIAFMQEAGFASAGELVGEQAKEALDSLGTLLRDAIAPLRQKLADSATSADEIELTLGVGLKAEGKWIIASMEGTSTITVKLVWKKPT
ncbi:hypothetical protein C8R32_102315 [Nitrosospira sp. Nsp5]|uniref:Trypsin-co-occurring domain-containing protein n=1 Tax=Nitrosospira multiformis TaxID=1231 RepID=A0ABY0TJR6_9PROT|nr:MULTISPECIES: CU044_2847 family protein [Nitrosospira]PTR10225.1 hypothetical protein C8R32_102315 [Nitrosospira sp. Nsp5]SDQ94801.1 hypothetical protein SAMN05216402_2943 [Nitrosospira multiformis]